jgi:basic amino acid/polyamine antiporter, APA family
MAEASYKVVDRQIGPLGATVLLVGTVIGISVFLLPGELIDEAGPSIVFALLLTLPPMIFSVLLLLQLGGALPVAGGVYVYASRLVGPFWGFITVWLVIPAIWSVLLFTAIGFAHFFAVLFPVAIPEPILVAGVLGAFIALNLRGVTLVTTVQLIMVAAILVGFLVFILPGLFEIDTANYTPAFPRGAEPFLLAIVSLYIPFQGYSMIIELGEELKDPIRNIPRVLLLGMTVAVLLSVLLVVVFVGLDRWDVLGDYDEGGVAEAARDYLPVGIGTAVAIAAILGAFTTLNALITSYSRTVMRAARDEVLSPKMARIHPKTQVPHRAILMLTIPPLLLAPLELSPVLLSVFLALIILFGSFILAIALWNLPKRHPDAY